MGRKPLQPDIIDNNETVNNIGFNIDDIVYKPTASTSSNSEQRPIKPSKPIVPSSQIKKPTLPPEIQFEHPIGVSSGTGVVAVKPPSTLNKKSTASSTINTNDIVTAATVANPSANRQSGFNSALTKLLPDSVQADIYEKKIDEKFDNSNRLLAQTITQADYLFVKVEEELEKYKKNSSFGGKSRAIAMSTLLNTQANILGTKINAIRESNNTRKAILENILKRDQMQMQARMKVFAPKEDVEQNSDKAIADAYYSIINASRYGLPTVHNPLAQSSINTGISLQGNIIPTSSLNTPIVTSNVGEMQPNMAGDPLNSFMGNNMSPNQKRMILEHNPNVKIVVFYDQSTGGKKFEALDVNTGKIIPGVQLPASFLLEDMRIDFNNALAYNSSANLNYPLVITGRRAVDEL